MTLPCPICGGELREQVAGCSRCPLNGGCDMVCCENCGYETVAPRSTVVGWLQRLRSFWRAAAGARS